ncbi:MAG: Gfo/Idh/MocA family oxidoreductase [Deltaproteobacteria bacterium]|nr:Gfo/Idh/MocA family oxidoreductase [Deltaproteobacteria bacterium]
MTPATIGFAIIGTGTIARVHAAALGEVAEARLIAGSSRDVARAQSFAADFGCEATTNWREHLTDPRVNTVIITTSSGSHANIAMEAMAAGKNVIVEKPMALHTDDARAMIACAHQTGRALSVIFQRRYEPVHQALKQAMPALGRLLFAEVSCPFHRPQAYYDSAPWRGTEAEDGGALMNQAIHSVDLLLWLCGPATKVYAECATQMHAMEAEDLAVVVAQLQGGAKATLMASTNILPGFPATLAIYGQHGSVRLSGAEVVHWSVPGVPAPAPASPASVGVATNILASHEYHRAQLQDVVDATLAQRPPPIEGSQGFAALALVEAAYSSARLGHPVDVARL